MPQSYSARLQEQTLTMTAGPVLDDDGHTLVVPSEWYNEDAVRFWKSKGFEWRPQTAAWVRDTRKPLDGETYTLQAWLTAARRQFYRFWPDPPPPRRDQTRNTLYRATPAEPVDPEMQAAQRAALADLRRRQQEQKDREEHRRYAE